MSPREAHDNSHCSFVPPKVSGHQTTTIWEQTLENHIAATFLSCANLAQPGGFDFASYDQLMSGPASLRGANTDRPANGARNTRADSIPFASGPPFERRKIREPSFDERELGAGFLFLAMVIAPLLFVGLIVLLFVKT